MTPTATPAYRTWVVFDARGWWYCGHTEGGNPVCDSTFRTDAIELDDRDVAREFPNGLPAGWAKEEA